MPRVSTRPPDISPQSALLEAVKNRTGSLRKKFFDDPIGLAERLGLTFPEKPVKIMQRAGKYDPAKHGPITPGLRDLIYDVCNGLITDAVAVANRGGGKSQGVSFIEFFLVFIKDYDALNLGGSELQAQGVYNYLVQYIEHDKEFQDMVKGDIAISQTHTKFNAWIRVLTASQKSVRSPHAGGRKPGGRMAGGILVIDEEAEAAPEIVAAALPTINTARPSVNVRASTFHNAEGSFKDVIENADAMGYTVYNWDIFDTAEKCDCVGECQSPEPCFREDHYEDVADPITGEVERKLVHRAYCGGRAMYAAGWTPMSEIVKLWKRFKRNHALWEVEAMGSRPSSKGFVIRDLRQLEENFTDQTGAEIYEPGRPISICVDWGTRAAGVELWQHLSSGAHALIHAEQVEEAGLTQIISLILSLRKKYLGEFTEVAADIGGGGNYLNPHLRENYRVVTRDVNFAEIKESAVAALNVFNESNQLVIPKEFTEFIHQAQNWKRKDGRIKKGDDHLMDSSLCYFSKFIDEIGVSHIKVPPRSARSTPTDERDRRTMIARAAMAGGRVSAVRALGGKPVGYAARRGRR